MVEYHGSQSSDCLIVGGSYLNEYSIKRNIRPIVYLKATVTTNGKDSSGAWTIIDK